MRIHSPAMLLPCGVLAACILLAAPDAAHAGYLDPGSGSTLVQGIVAAVAAVKRFWNGLLGIFGLGGGK